MEYTDTECLKGPGSPSTERFPSISPTLGSASRLDDDEQPQSEFFFNADGLSENTYFPDEDSDEKIHVVIVGGDIAALSAALALTEAGNVKITLVIVGLGLDGSASLAGTGSQKRGLQLCTRTVSLLESLGFPANLSRKGKEKAGSLRNPQAGPELHPGVIVEGFSLRRYEDGSILTKQPYKALAPRHTNSREVPGMTIDSDDLRNILLNLCSNNPNISLRTRCEVAAILPQQHAPIPFKYTKGIVLDSKSLHDEYSSEMVELDSDTFGVEETAAGDIGSFSSSKTMFASNSVQDRRPTSGMKYARSERQDFKHKRRESFIHFDDEEVDVMESTNYSPVSPQIKELEEPSDLDPFASEDSLPKRIFSGEKLVSPSVLRLRQRGEDAEFDVLQNVDPVVVLTSGEEIFADIILGSTAQSEVLRIIRESHGKYDNVNNYTVKGDLESLREDRVYRAYVPADKLRRETELADIIGDEVVSWLGPGRHVTCFPTHGGEMYYISVASVQPKNELADDPSSIVRRMKDEVAGWCPQVVTLISLVDSATMSTVNDYVAPEDWISNCGRIALIGDAAHPLLPFAPQETSLMIEDAITLRSLFSLIQSNEHWDRRTCGASNRSLLQAFVALRRPRCIRAQLMLRAGRDMFWMPDGEAQKMRDLSLREGGLLSEEEENLEHRFDPAEVVELWWREEGPW